MATYKTTFVVEGTSDFPIDMLRYDSCYPYTGSDVSGVTSPERFCSAENLSAHRRVKLCTVHNGRIPNLTPDRWRSFGWRIVDGETRTDKVT